MTSARRRPSGYAGHASPFGSLRGCATRSPKKTDAAIADDISPSSPFGLCRARFALGSLRGCATRSPKGEAWWSQAGSNRRPRHCERRALPAELWPRRDRLEMTRSDRQSAPFTVRPKAESRTVKASILASFCRELHLFAGVRTDI